MPHDPVSIHADSENSAAWAGNVAAMTDEAKNQLREAITLAPSDLTARLLLSVALNRVRYRLSPEAS